MKILLFLWFIRCALYIMADTLDFFPEAAVIICKKERDYQACFDKVINDIIGYPLVKVFSEFNDYCNQTLFDYPVPELNLPNESDLSYILMTDGQNTSVPLSDPQTLPSLAEFNETNPLVILITGWGTVENSTHNNALGLIQDAYRCRGNVNFVVIDTAEFLDQIYTWTAFNSEIIGRLLAESLEVLIESYPIEKVHLIGHSLGAQVVGSAGRNFYKRTHKKLHRITALEPANPCFGPGNDIPTLSKNDAEFVLVIHSNPGCYGKRKTSGHADFYSNGLYPLTPGCINNECAHLRAAFYYAESVYPGNEHNFLGTHCCSFSDLKNNDCQGKVYPMGYATPSTARGIFNLKTNAVSPFGLNAKKNYEPICNV